MKRKMIGAAAAYLSGLFFASFFTDAKGVLIFAAAGVVVYFCGKKRNFTRADFCMMLVCFVTACVMNAAYTRLIYEPALSYAGQTGSFVGTVKEYELHSGGKSSYVLKGRINGKTKAKIYFYSDTLGADFGDTIVLENCEFQAPESGFLFDTERYYRAEHISLNVYNAEDIRVQSNDRCRLKKALAAYREKTIAEFIHYMGEDSGSVLAGMVFGEKKYIDSNTRSVMYLTGIGHVLAVSGLHISLLAVFVWSLLRRFGVSKVFTFAVMNVLVLLLTALAEYPVSAVRALIMVDIMYSAKLFYRQNDPLNSLAIACSLISFFDPYCAHNSGFLLSLTGTFGIAVFAPYMTKDMPDDTSLQRAVKLLSGSVCVTLAVFPVCIYFFGETSLISPFTNLLLIPLCTVSMTAGEVYMLTFGLFPALLAVPEVLIKAVITVSEHIYSLGVFNVSDRTGILMLLLFITAAEAVLVHMLTDKKRFIAYTAAAGIAVFTLSSVILGAYSRNTFRAAVLGKGNTAAVVITHSGHTDVVDLSGHYRSGKYVRKYLSENGFPAPDTVLLTKRSPSEAVVYMDELKYMSPKKYIVSGDVDPCCGDVELTGSEVFTITSGDLELRYDNGTLNINAGGNSLAFVPASKADGSDEMTVYYGTLPKDVQLPDIGIYLGEMNNFEIYKSRKNGYKIRRL